MTGDDSLTIGGKSPFPPAGPPNIREAVSLLGWKVPSILGARLSRADASSTGAGDSDGSFCDCSLGDLPVELEEFGFCTEEEEGGGRTC